LYATRTALAQLSAEPSWKPAGDQVLSGLR
jgi:hypothetical protein